MMFKNKFYSLLAVFLLVITLLSCFACEKIFEKTNTTLLQKKALSMPQNIEVNVGEQTKVFFKRYPDKIRIVHQPAGLDFYKMDWDARPRPTVTIQHGKYSFNIDDVVGISSIYDHDLPHEGLSKFEIYSGLSSVELLPHDEARFKIYAILQNISRAGWRTTIYRSRPRLSGKERLDYALNLSDSIGLDTNYIPTLEEWMRIESYTSWSFYADHLYMSVNFDRERTLTDPLKPGAYLLTFDIKSEAEYFRGYVKSEDRLRWKELLPAELAKLAPLRAQKETEMRAKGVKIDETYQDPPVPDLK